MAKMKRLFSITLSLLATVPAAYAAIPVIEQGSESGTISLSSTVKPMTTTTASAGRNTWSEGFEGRIPGYYWKDQEWLPNGWVDESKMGHTQPDSKETGGWNLTWQTMSTDTGKLHCPYSDYKPYSGEYFAYIMCDVAYSGHETLPEQDEWLITPSVTPAEKDWFYFRLLYSPGWTIYNRESGKFDGLTTNLQIYVTDDNGANWRKLWDAADDDARINYTEAELQYDKVTYHHEYIPVYINIREYAGKTVKFAFRYYGKEGYPVCIDDVAVGVPQPKAHYKLPAGVFYEGASPRFDYPSTFRMIAPHDTEINWANTSSDYLTTSWTYADATGATATSENTDLVTPAYSYGSIVATPMLQTFFEDSQSEPYSLGATKMQAGGILVDTDSEGYSGEFGAGNYNIFDSKVRYTAAASGPGIFSFSPETDAAWEVRTGSELGTIHLIGLGQYFRRGDRDFGFDFASVMAYVSPEVPDTAILEMDIIAVDEYGALSSVIGTAQIKGSEMEKNVSSPVCLKFNFPVPVYAESDFVAVIAGDVKAGYIKFPYLVTANPSPNTAHYALLSIWDSNNQAYYDQLGDLSTLDYDPDLEFAGLIMDMGISYSDMATDNELIFNAPAEGGTHQLNVRAHHKPERWQLTDDGLFPCSWADFTATYNEADDSYDVAVTAKPNSLTEARESDLWLVSPGSRLKLSVSQPSAIEGIEADRSDAPVEYFNLQGIRIGSPSQSGFYIRRQGTDVSKEYIRK